MPHQTELQSGNKKTVTDVHAFTPKHTLSSRWPYDKWNWCNWWEWVIWIISNYRGSRESKEEELREWKRAQPKGNSKPEATASAFLPTGDAERACICPKSAWFRDVCENVICLDSQSHPSTAARFTAPPPQLSPLYQRDWLLRKWGLSVTQNHTSLTGGAHAWILSPPLPPRPPGFKGRGLCGGQVWRLSWRPDSAWWTFLYEIWKHGAWRTFLL